MTNDMTYTDTVGTTIRATATRRLNTLRNMGDKLEVDHGTDRHECDLGGQGKRGE